jgi:hypothetical protein
MKDLQKYRAELQRKIDAVDVILADMGGGRSNAGKTKAVKQNGRKKGKRKMSAAAKAKISAAKRAYWAEKKKSAK